MGFRAREKATLEYGQAIRIAKPKYPAKAIIGHSEVLADMSALLPKLDIESPRGRSPRITHSRVPARPLVNKNLFGEAIESRHWHNSFDRA